MATGTSFGQWLQLRRRGLGLSQTELGKMIGYSGETIRKLEADSVRPSKQLAARLAEVLESAPEKRADFVRFARGEDTDVPSLPAPNAPLTLQPPKRRTTNLPVPPTSLIGREGEMADVGELLQRPDVRLVTLTGSGGTGKTRLALEVASKARADFPDGVYLVSLAAISDPTLVPTTIAQTLNVRELSNRPPLDSLKQYLWDKQALLLLDNFEQVIAAASVLSELLAHAPQLKLLVTSRMRLRIRGEKEFPVFPLVLPNVEDLASLERLSQCASVQLFIQRVRDVRSDFEVTKENAAAVAEICQRLDGLPLALELAAPHVKVFSPETLLERLNSRLDLLTQGPRDLPIRQQSLHNTITWSYELLEEAEQKLFRRLAVFVGGWTVEAAAAVWNAEGQRAMDVLDGLASLVDKGLIYQSGNVRGKQRFWMLDTVQEYAREQLMENGEAENLRRQHATFFLSLAERAEPELTGSEQVAWAARLENDYYNLRAALEWCQTPTGDPDIGLRLAGALWRFWMHRGYLAEGRMCLSNALARATDSTNGVRAKALNGAAGLAYQQGEYATARTLNQQSLALRRELDDREGVARSLGNLGLIAHRQGDYTTARALYEESLTLEQQLGDRWGMAWILTALGLVAHDQGNFTEARALYEQALALNRDLRSTRGIALILANLGEVAYHQGDYAGANAYFDQSLSLYRNADDRANMILALHGLGNVARNLGDIARAHTLYQQSLTIGREMEDKRAIAECLEGVAGMQTLRGQLETAARLFGAAATLRETIGSPLPPARCAEYDRYLATVRSQLNASEFLRAWTQGRAMTPEQATTYVLREEINE